jgi:DNA polymerase-1
MTQPIKKLFLLDGMSLIYRAHFAFGAAASIATASGLKTGAILGFVNTLVEMLHKEQPTHVVVAFDAKEKTFRHTLFSDYKSHRQAQPEDISTALPHIKAILEGFGIVFIEQPGYEADDILGTLAQRAVAMGFHTYIMSTDKDLAQMVQHNVFLYKPGRNGQKATIWGEKEVVEAWGITRPAQVVDVLALEGDASDFIPGIPSIGKKTAQKLIQTFGTFENVLAHSHQLRGTVQKNLIQYAQQGILSKKLVAICTHVPIDLDLDSCTYREPDPSKLLPLLTLLELKGVQKRLFPKQTASEPKGPIPLPDLFDTAAGNVPPMNSKDAENHIIFSTINDVPHCYTLVETVSDCCALVQRLQQTAVWAFDTESTGLDPHQATLLGISFSCSKGTGYYVAIPSKESEKKLFVDLLKPLFLSTSICKVGQNLKYDLILLERSGIHVSAPLFDTMIAHALLEPDMRHNLTALSEKYLHYTPVSIETLIGPKGKNQKNMLDVPLRQVALYASEDADLALQLYEKLAPALQEQLLEKLFYTVEMPLVPVLVSMERAGVSLDTDFLTALGAAMRTEALQLQEQIYASAGMVFHIGSPKQLGMVLFEKLNLIDNPVKTSSGQYATGEEVLAKLADAHPIVTEVLAYRELQKLRSTYVDALPTLLHSTDGRIHTSYQQTIVSTGRLSSVNPNLQNIPIRTEKGRALRKAFIPHAPGDLLFSADYSQIELRVMAAYAQDATMIQAFKEDQDIHQITASKLFNVPLDEVDGEMRRKAKVANFGIIYGISAFGLAQRMGNLSRGEAARLIAAYFNEFPGIKHYMEQTIASAREKGYVTTLLGRKRFLPDIQSRNAVVRGFAERNAINTPIQGSAAELIKLAMIHIQAWLQQEGLRSKMILQVHDELVFNVPAVEVPLLQQHIPRLMAEAFPLDNVPIKVHWGVGAHWLEAHA